MCGIVGKLNFHPQAEVSPQLIKRMIREIDHRGPDDEGIWVNGNIGLGHRRLSIIDVTRAGRQPMCNEDETVWITYNGEIYNFPELRKDLLKKGHRFRSHTDTEVILHLYEEYGIKCLSYLRGMFAFGLWDARQKKLFLARDRIGQKPLKYFLDENCLIFASELKAILLDPGVKREADLEAIDSFLTYQYVPHPKTGLKGIKKLPHAHYLVCQEGKVTIEKYWSLDFSRKLNWSEEKLTEGILDKLRESVKLRLISDVPLGACLSGGIDSSAMVAIMAGLMDQSVKTFSVGFEEESFNELPYARRISEIYRTDHHVTTVRPSAAEVLPELVWHYEEPFADPSALPTYYLFRMIKSKVKVVLTGDAGDENFAGYHRYVRMKQLSYYQNIPNFFRTYLIENVLELLLKITRKSLFYTVLRYARSSNDTTVNKYLSVIGYFMDYEKQEIYSPDFRSQLHGYHSEDFLGNFLNSNNPLEKYLSADFDSYLPDDLMVKVDIASMAHSIECRVPMLDHEFLEFVARIPFEYKLKGFNKKYILKKTMGNYLPAEIISRKKMGFGVPVNRWLRNELKEFTYECLLSRQCLDRGYFRKEGIRKLLDQHTKAGIDQGNKIWALLWLELWHRKFLDQ